MNKPGSTKPNPKKPKYHFEGTQVDEQGKKIYMVLELKTGEILQWDEKVYQQYQGEIEY